MAKAKRLKLIDGSELELFTSSGWTIVKTFENASEVYGYVENTNAMHPTQGYMVPSSNTRSHVITRPKFLIEAPEDLDEMLRLKNLTEELDKKLRAASADVGKANAELKQGVFRENQLNGRILQLDADVAAWQAKARKLEGDLAKVRGAIGDLKWKEIVGG